MPQKVITYRDAVVTIHVPLMGGEPTVDVRCGMYSDMGMSLDEFAAMIYPSIAAKASLVPIGTCAVEHREDDDPSPS